MQARWGISIFCIWCCICAFGHHSGVNHPASSWGKKPDWVLCRCAMEYSGKKPPFSPHAVQPLPCSKQKKGRCVQWALLHPSSGLLTPCPLHPCLLPCNWPLQDILYVARGLLSHLCDPLEACHPFPTVNYTILLPGNSTAKDTGIGLVPYWIEIKMLRENIQHKKKNS